MIALIRRVVTIDWPKQINSDAKKLLIDTAADGHKHIMADALAKGLGVPSWTAYANNPGNSDLQSVVLPGPIVYNYRYVSDLIQKAMDELQRQSPRVSGEYARGHTIFVNGQAVDAIPSSISASDQIFIANLVPYSRKIEIGKTKSGRDFVIQVPNLIYKRVAEMLQSEARGRAKVTYGFIDVGSYSLKQNQTYRRFTASGVRHSQRQRPDRVAGSAVTSPAIFFSAPF